MVGTGDPVDTSPIQHPAILVGPKGYGLIERAPCGRRGDHVSGESNGPLGAVNFPQKADVFSRDGHGLYKLGAHLHHRPMNRGKRDKRAHTYNQAQDKQHYA